VTERKGPPGPPPPPRKKLGSKPELVLIGEDDAPITERVGTPDARDVFIPPPPPAVREPFRLLHGKTPPRVPTMAELGASIASMQTALGHFGASNAEVIVIQRKMARQIDGLVQSVNTRFDIFHKELALLRATVTGDHETRIGDVEDRVEEQERITPSERARRIARTGGIEALRSTLGGAVLLALLKLAAARWPELGLDGFIP
jgi:hypothetical protein